LGFPLIRANNVALTTPPAVNGTYFVPTGATGVWAGNVGKMATTTDGGATWTYATLSEGQEVYDLAGHALYTVNALGALASPGAAGATLYIAQATAPAHVAGLTWENTSAAVVSGVAPGKRAQSNGTTWKMNESCLLVAKTAGTQSVPSGSITMLTDLSVISRNEFGSGAFSAGVFTVPAGMAGNYTLSELYLPTSTSPTSSTIVLFYIDGVFEAQSGDTNAGSGGGLSGSAMSIERYLNAGQTVDMRVAQTSGTASLSFSMTHLSILRHP
jgi:Protein of unknown function (DUF2793)